MAPCWGLPRPPGRCPAETGIILDTLEEAKRWGRGYQDTAGSGDARDDRGCQDPADCYQGDREPMGRDSPIQQPAEDLPGQVQGRAHMALLGQQDPAGILIMAWLVRP
jgi:hypothetical protein